MNMIKYIRGQKCYRLLVLIGMTVVIGWGIESRADEMLERRDAALIENKSGQSDAERLRELFKIRWEYNMTESPEWATYVGYPGQNQRWTDSSLPAIERRKRELQTPLKVLQTIDRKKLSA